MNKTIRKNSIFLATAVLVLALGVVSAGDFKIQNSTGTEVFTVSTTGGVNASGYMTENGTLLSELYLLLSGGALTGIVSSDSNITTSAFFVGDGSYLTSVPTLNSTYAGYATDGVTIKYQNISNLPTCSNTERLTFDGTDLACTAFDNTNIAYYNETVTWSANQQISADLNITGDITGVEYVNASYFVGAGSKLTDLPADMAVIKYQNISNLPTCGAGEHLDYDGSALTCTADSGGDFTNVAYLNNSNIWNDTQLHDANVQLNDTATLEFMSNDSAITRDGVETTNISIDSLGNVIIRLG